MMVEGGGLRFVPSRVDGLAEVTRVTVYPDRLELISEGRVVTVRFADIAGWPRPAFLWRRLHGWGWRPRWPSVGARDWFHPPSERFFRFDTEPCIVVSMPGEPRETAYGQTLFRRIRDVMLQGGFGTRDLG